MVNPITLKIRTKKLGILIKDARLASGKTMKECANILGISPRQISAFEQGEKAPSLPELEVLAFYLDIPLDHFFHPESLYLNREEIAPPNLRRLVSLREKIVGARLKQARTEAGVDLETLANSIGITKEQASAYESGSVSIPLPELEGMVEQLGFSLEKFLDSEGIIGKWADEKRAVQEFLDLPAALQKFVTKPVNKPYLEIAQRLSGMQVEKLRALAEGLLDITL